MTKLVLDLETKKSFDEVGGADNKAQLGVSLVGVYDYGEDKFATFREEVFSDLQALLQRAELIIGFNLVDFDWPVLAAELGDWVLDLPTLDLMVEVQKGAKQRVSLGALAKTTLGMSKLGSGLDALEYYRLGDWARLERYCLEDVKLTRDLYEYAQKNGNLLFQKGANRGVIPMSFAESPYAKLFKAAAQRKESVKMFYGAKERLVDVYRFDGVYIRAYCHLRKEERTFRLDRVEDAEVVASSAPLFS